jgi:hypothetical protein
MSCRSHLLVLAFAGLMGCGRYYAPEFPERAEGHGEFGWLDRYGRIRSTPSPSRRGDVYVSSASFGPPMPPSARDRVTEPDRSRAFDPRAARAAFEKADLSSCVAAGATAGFGHARVTLRPEGYVERIVIDAPPGMPPAAVECTGRELGRVRVAPFDGNPITIGTTYLVKN